MKLWRAADYRMHLDCMGIKYEKTSILEQIKYIHNTFEHFHRFHSYCACLKQYYVSCRIFSSLVTGFSRDCSSQRSQRDFFLSQLSHSTPFVQTSMSQHMQNKIKFLGMVYRFLHDLASTYLSTLILPLLSPLLTLIYQHFPSICSLIILSLFPPQGC